MAVDPPGMMVVCRDEFVGVHSETGLRSGLDRGVMFDHSLQSLKYV